MAFAPRKRPASSIRADGSREWIKLSAYAAELTRDDWVEVIWPFVEGGQKLDAQGLVDILSVRWEVGTFFE